MLSRFYKGVAQILAFAWSLSYAAHSSHADCSLFFQEMKCPEESLVSGPYEWTEEPNTYFKILFNNGTCSSVYQSAGLNPLSENCKSQVRVCASKKTAKLHGPMYVCSENKRIVLHFKDGKLDGPYTVYSPGLTVIKQGEYAAGTPIHAKGRTISSEKPAVSTKK